MDDRSGVAIAEVVKELKAGRARPFYWLENDSPWVDQEAYRRTLAQAQLPGPVIDATQIYQSLVANPKPVYLYEDHPCVAPPWPSALICYVNEHGNVIIMCMCAKEFAKGKRVKGWDDAGGEIDWSEVRWVNEITIWVGGRSVTTGEALLLTGPMHLWWHAIYDGGAPADYRWVHLCPEYPKEHWDMAQIVFLGALNFMNCRNVDIVEPSRRRAEARQISRTGVRVSVINVFPTGKSTRSESANKGCGVPLTSVRGHFSCYGPEYGKGLLFGKLAGRFWIPQHARGNKELGEIQNSYVLNP